MGSIRQLIFFSSFLLFLLPQISFAGDCPVGLVSGKTLDEEFGPGSTSLTRCLKREENIKVLYQANQKCRSNGCLRNRAYALGNIRNAIKDYEITHGLKRGEDYRIVLVAHSGGADLMVSNDNLPPNIEPNQFEEEVKDLLAKGVKIYLCQNTARSKGIKTEHLIPGVRYVTAGVTAIGDFQAIGYEYIQP